jgi:RNA polymerase sigma factor (TIGR02999 family)
MGQPNDFDSQLGEVTVLLQRINDPGIEDEVLKRCYGKLRHIARKLLVDKGSDLSLRVSDVVSEAYIRFKGAHPPKFDTRAHFLGFMRTEMKRAVFDYADKKRAQKRFGSARQVSLDDVLQDLRHNGLSTADSEPEMVLTLRELLERLNDESPLHSSLVELFYFQGLEHTEILMEYDGMTIDVLKKHLQFARRWMHSQLTKAPSS